MQLSPDGQKALQDYLRAVKARLADRPPQASQDYLAKLSLKVHQALAARGSGRPVGAADVRAVLVELQLVRPRAAASSPAPGESRAGLAAAATAPVADPAAWAQGKSQTVKVQVKSLAPSLASGRYDCLISPTGVALRSKTGVEVALPVGCDARHVGGPRLSVAWESLDLEMTVRASLKYANRLAGDLAEFLGGHRGMPVVKEYSLPWYFIAAAMTPALIPVLTLGGLIPTGIACVLVGACLGIVQTERLSALVRLGACLAIGGVGILATFTVLPTIFGRGPGTRRSGNPTPGPQVRRPPTGGGPKVRRDPPARPVVPQPPRPPRPRPQRIDSVDTAVAALRSGKSNEQRDAARWLAGAAIDPAQAPKVRAAMLPLLDTTDVFLIEPVAAVFCRLAGPEDVPLLARLAGGDARKGKGWSQALGALMRLDGPAGRRIIEGRSEDFFFRVGAQKALVALGAGQEKDILPLLRSAAKHVPKLACDVLGEIGTPECIPAIRDAAEAITDRGEKFRFEHAAKAAILKIEQRHDR